MFSYVFILLFITTLVGRVEGRIVLSVLGYGGGGGGVGVGVGVLGRKGGAKGNGNLT